MSWCNVSLLVALPANGNLMKTLYIVPTTASGTNHSVCTRKGLKKNKQNNPLPADAIKANVIHSWCNPGCNNLHILSKTSYSEANKSCLVASSQGEKLYSLLMQWICMEHCGDDVPISKAPILFQLQNTFRKKKKKKSASSIHARIRCCKTRIKYNLFMRMQHFDRFQKVPSKKVSLWKRCFLSLSRFRDSRNGVFRVKYLSDEAEPLETC